VSAVIFLPGEEELSELLLVCSLSKGPFSKSKIGEIGEVGDAIDSSCYR
jgi:hypothetical protein